MNKLILLALVISLASAQNSSGRFRGSGKRPSDQASPAWGPAVCGFAPSDLPQSGPATGTPPPLGEAKFPFFDQLTQKANSLAADFANDPCVKKVVEKIETDAIACVLGWKEKRSILDAVNCAGKVMVDAKGKLQDECKLNWN